MPWYILTGTPGSGKTAILRQLELNGHAVVEEAATDVIAVQQALGNQEPWRDAAFLDSIVTLQRQRQLAATAADTDAGRVTVFDRSPVCTLALSRHLAQPAPRRLLDEIERMVRERFYAETVFFVRGLGFVQATAARRIGLEDALAFERIHEQTYREYGFDLIEVPAGPLPARVAIVEQTLNP